MNLLLVYVKETKALAVMNVEEYVADETVAVLGVLPSDTKKRNHAIQEATSSDISVDRDGNVRFN